MLPFQPRFFASYPTAVVVLRCVKVLAPAAERETHVKTEQKRPASRNESNKNKRKNMESYKVGPYYYGWSTNPHWATYPP